MNIITQFNQLTNNIKSKLLVEPIFYKVLQDNRLTQEEKLAIIKKGNLLENLAIDTFNNKTINGFSVNALTYCLSHSMFNLGTYFLSKEGIDFESIHNHEKTFNTIMKYVVIDSTEEFYQTLFSKKIALKNIDPYEHLYLIFSDAENESTITGFINCFDIDLKKFFHSHVYHGALGFIQERLHVHDKVVKAILNSEQFNLADLQKISKAMKDTERGDRAKALIDEKIIEKEKEFLESQLMTNPTTISNKKKQKI
jgi:hypothetical protein